MILLVLHSWSYNEKRFFKIRWRWYSFTTSNPETSSHVVWWFFCLDLSDQIFYDSKGLLSPYVSTSDPYRAYDFLVPSKIKFIKRISQKSF